METQYQKNIKIEDNPDKGPPKECGQKNDGSSATQVLDTMRNLIVE